jgi:outer membrane protein TolC
MDTRPLALLFVAACATSIEGDLARVRDLSHAIALAAVGDGAVDPATSEDVRALLRDPIDADRAARIALLNNRDLRAELRSIGIERGELVQAGLIPNPVFEAEALPERDTRVELRLEYDLTALFLAPIRSAAAEASLEARRHQIAGAVIELGYRARIALYAVEAAEQRLAIAQRSLDALAAARDAAVALRNAGNLPELEALAPITAYERARVTVAELELDLAGARERVHRLLGLFGEDTSWRTSGALPDVPVELTLPDHLETRAVEGSVDLAELKARMSALALRASVSRSEGWIPDIEVDVHSLYGHPEEPAADASLWRFGAGVSLSVPLFDRNQGTALRHESELDADAERLHAMAVDLRSAVREAKGGVASSFARATHYRDRILPGQSRVVDQTLLQYNAMQIGIFQLLEAHAKALELELELVDTTEEYWGAKARLDALLGGRMVSAAPMRQGSRMRSAAESRGGH